MKIFNWVHRKFHNPHAHSSSAVVYSRQNDELKRNNNVVENNNNNDAASLFGFHTETQTLLKEVALVDMPQCWKEGILTIGTLGSSLDRQDNFAQLTKLEEEFQAQVAQVQQEEDCNNFNNFEIEEEEANNNSGSNPLVEEEEKEKNKFLLKDAVRRSLDENKQELIRVCEIIEAAENKKAGLGLRTTLADLFSAESPSKEANKPKKLIDQASIKKSSSGRKPPLPINLVKKIIPRSDDNSRLVTKNFNKLMRRMLKRKIHPDIGGKDQANDGINNVSPNNGEELSANEGVSLLQPQGGEMKA